MPGATNKRRGGPRRRPAGPSVLILRLDHDKLVRDGLTLGEEVAFGTRLGQLCLGAQVATVNGTAMDELLQQLGKVARHHSRFNLIVVIGHSNDSGIRLASDRWADWPLFAEYLRPFSPRKLALIACLAGGEAVSRQLFSVLPTLNYIYASPDCIGVDLANLILLLSAHALSVRRPSSDLVSWAKAAALGGCGRRLKIWRRKAARSAHDDWEDLLFSLR